MMKKIIALSFLGSLLLSGCASKDNRNLNEEATSERQFLLGTYVQVSIYNKGKKEVLSQAFDLIKKLGNEIDVNDDGHESQIDKVNDSSGEKATKVDADIFKLVKKSIEYAKESGGSFDPTIGTITSLWHIGFDDARKPSQKEIDKALQYVNYKDVVLDEKKHSVYLKKKGMKLDLGAIAKGFITDEVVSLLQKNGVNCAIVDLGGNVFVMGHSYRAVDKPWTVGIQDPNKARNTVVGYLPGVNRSFVTSGIYERYLKVDGEVYHHIMNPKTGYPFKNDIAGVTISSSKSIDGDALSTTIFSLGLKKGMAFIERRKDVEAVFVTRENKIYKTKGVEKAFELNAGNGYVLAD